MDWNFANVIVDIRLNLLAFFCLESCKNFKVC
jgi:hypothetical protein